MSMTKDEWIDAVARQLGRTMPDEFPDGFSRYMAEQYAAEGGYERFLAGDFAKENLWEPEGRYWCPEGQLPTDRDREMLARVRAARALDSAPEEG